MLLFNIVRLIMEFTSEARAVESAGVALEGKLAPSSEGRRGRKGERRERRERGEGSSASGSGVPSRGKVVIFSGATVDGPAPSIARSGETYQ
jgi:hypothetical protein